MPGALVFVVAMVLVVPVGVMAAGALWSAVFGWLEPADDTGTDTAGDDA
ncbi:MAG TPA: hypothetical protein VLV81_09490 [Acidimicrobiia bacterium]|nr:hypothetical protein [Acidimicrobiia bacterium]